MTELLEETMPPREVMCPPWCVAHDQRLAFGAGNRVTHRGPLIDLPFGRDHDATVQAVAVEDAAATGPAHIALSIDGARLTPTEARALAAMLVTTANEVSR